MGELRDNCWEEAFHRARMRYKRSWLIGGDMVLR